MTNNMASIRGRAEEVAHQLEVDGLSSLAVGYVLVALTLQEAAEQLRIAAYHNLSGGQLVEMAGRLDALAEDAILLGDAEVNR